jgi:hypothetical protein
LLVLLGAALLWFGERLLARPVETHKALSEFGQRGHKLPDWLQSRPFPRFLKGYGAFLMAVGVALVVGGVWLYVASSSLS